MLPAGSTSPEKLFESITQGRSGIHDKRKLDPYWEQDFYSDELVSDRSTSGLVGLVNDEDIVAPPEVNPEVFAGFTRAQKLLAIALAPCAETLTNSNRVLCLMGTTADGFEDHDNFAVMRYSGIDQRQANHGDRLGQSKSATQDPYAAVREVFDCIVRPGLEIVLVDAACASSLYAVSLGMQALESNEADTVLAGGMFCPGPGNNVLFSQFGGLTSTGCRPFDAGADGVVFSEGAAIVVLQRKEDAVRSGKHIHAVVRGAGLSSDGRSPSANVPQTAGQLHALKRCYKNYDIDPQSISAIEAHGTSTPAGDSTEVRTLSQFFQPVAKNPLPIHSLKGLIGHSGWAAGTASIIAATEMLRRGAFPAQATHSSDSTAVTETEGLLQVPKTPVALPASGARIAIDGFGFGGSNAHVVVESGQADSDSSILPNEVDDELVVIGVHQSQPTVDESGTLRFDRQALKSLDGIIMLPDLNDDMDVTQSLALDAIGNAIKSVAGFSDELREETGVVLALCGKTERAVEATCRVLTPRLQRTLRDFSNVGELNAAIEKSRPSGAYTLQCMMPNVSAGRAALQFNLKGPNFVVDSGSQSLEAAIRSGRMLLQNGSESGTRIAIVSAMHANRWPVPGTDAANCNNEFAAAFVITTRKFAEQNNLESLCPLQRVSEKIESLDRSTEEKTAAAVAVVTGQTFQPTNDERPVSSGKRLAADDFKLHTPVWVELPLWDSDRTRTVPNGKWLVFATAEPDLIVNLDSTLGNFCSSYKIVVVGERADELASSYGHHVSALDLNDESTALAGAGVSEMEPDLLLAFSGQQSWERFDASLERVAKNELCEALFVGMKQFVERIRCGQTEVYAMFPGGWQGSIHPNSGAFAGMLKSTKREMPDSRLGLISLRTTSVTESLASLNQERETADSSEIEIVRVGATRLVRRLQTIADPEATVGAATRSVQLSRDSVVVISGGARGVTALMAESLLENFGCRVVAFGRSALEKGPANYDSEDAEREYYARFISENSGVSPPEMKKSFESAHARWEACATIERLAQQYGDVEYMPVDVTDERAVHVAIGQVAEKFGRVDLVVHGAGVQWSKKLEDRTLAEFRKTFDVKVNGLRNLINSCQTRLGRLPAAHILTSAYSIYGNDGQHDYGAANEAMDRLCLYAGRFDQQPWTSIAWSAWDGIGMTRGSEYKSLAENRNFGLMDGPSGQMFFQQVITGRTQSTINVPLSGSEQGEYQIRTIPACKTSGRRILERPVCLSEIECLPYHKARGVLTLPGAWTVDLMVRAAGQLLPQQASYFVVEDMKFLRFVRADNQHDPNLRVVIAGLSGKFEAWLVGNVLNPDGITLLSDVVFAQATLSSLSETGSQKLQFEESNRNGSVRSVSDPYCAGDPNVDLSGPFDCLTQIEIGAQGRRATFEPKSNGWTGTVPSMLLDASLRVGGMHAVPDALHVPTNIERVVLPVGISTDSFAARGWRISAAAPQVMGDDILAERIEVVDQSGQVQVTIEGALVTRIR